MNKQYNLDHYDYSLPKELIAQKPADKRDHSRLMVVKGKEIEHRKFSDITQFFKEGDIIVMNNSKVIPARIDGHKETGGSITVDLSNKKEDCYECLIKGKKVRPNSILLFKEGLKAEVIEKNDMKFLIRFNIKNILPFLKKYGRLPTPGYIKEKITDYSRYQTVYAEHEGSIAAPTAGLHFTEDILCQLKEKGVIIVFVTLHVGIGTFMEVKCDDIRQHKMESEFITITKETADKINKRKGRLIICGTTTYRALESASKEGNVRPYNDWTDIFIYPGRKLNIRPDMMITNFHLPRSTLIMLISTYAGRDVIIDAYKKAVEEKYRFYSFGDSMLIIPDAG